MALPTIFHITHDKALRRLKTLMTSPTIFHITHYKAGSQWVLQVLTECAPGRIISPHVDLDQFYVDPLVPGAIYPTIYVPYSKFQEVLHPKINFSEIKDLVKTKKSVKAENWYNFSVRRRPVKKFVVIRDLRDTLVSLYFSIKVSHTLMSDQLANGRRNLNALAEEDGFLQILRPRGNVQAGIQLSWLPVCQRGEALLVRYEDLIADEMGQFEKIIKHCKLDVSKSQLEEIVSRNSFINRAGRKPGEEDVSSHHRKGVAGDWQNHFTDRIKDEFKKQFGQLLIDTGYEKDLNW